MNQDRTSKLIMLDLVNNNLIDLDNYDAIVPFFDQAYAVGSDFGMKRQQKGKAVVQLSPDGNKVAVYESTLEAAKSVGVHYDNIRKAARGVQHTCKGYKWKYLKEYKTE